MRGSLLFAVLTAGLFLNACGSKDESTGDYYQSCNLSDLGRCIESKNSTSMKEFCEGDPLQGAYAQTQCTVGSGSNGCAYKNENGVDVTEWFTGTTSTTEQVTAFCAGKSGGQVVTKQ